MKKTNAPIETNAEPEEKKWSPYDMLLIAESVKTPWNELSEAQQKAYEPYLTNQFVSSREEYAPLVAMISKYNLTPEQHYTFMCNIIDGSRKHYFDHKAYKKIKLEDDEKLLIWATEKEYEIGKREAMSYIKDMPELTKTKLKEKWKDSYDYYIKNK